MQGAITLGLKTLLREWRSGDLAVMFLALFVAVTAWTGVGFLVDRVDRAMQLQASEVLGADLRLRSTNPITASHFDAALKRGLNTASVTSMTSVVLRGDYAQLTNVYAVTAGYPLRGKVQVAAAPFGQGENVNAVPAPGEVWPDSRLLATLGANVGDVVTVGALELRVARVLVARPDKDSGFTELVPTLLMNLQDLPATQLIQPGSRALYTALFAGERAQVAPFAAWLEEHAARGERLRDIAEVSPEVSRASGRAARFLSLASLVGVLLCAVAIAMTARRYVKRHLDLAALLKTLGAAQSTVLVVSLVQLLGIALVAALAGAVVGYLAQQGLLSIVRDLLAVDLPPPGWRPVVTGVVSALLLLVGFALPSLLQLSHVPALRVLRRDIGLPQLGVWLAYGPAAAVVVLLVRLVMGEWPMTLWFVAGTAVTLAVLALAGWLLVWLVGKARGGVGASWRYGLANLARRRSETIVQIVALGMGLSALLLLTIIRTDLIDDWRARVPADAPNYFFVNIPAEEREAFRGMLEGQGGTLSRLLPMIRGRMTAINGVPVDQRKFTTPRGEAFATREQNLTWSDQIGASNTITEGQWFTAADHGKPLVSVATEFQEEMALKLGDELSFNIAGEDITARIASFRNVEWDSMQPNFFLMFAPGLLDGAAGTYMASAQFRPQSPGVVAQLVRRFSSVSIFDLDSLLAQVRSIIEKAVLAVQSVFLFTLLAGVVVLLAAVQATRDERRYESAMLRTLGASRSAVRTGVLVEFALLGLLAGLVSVLAASVGAYFIATRVLDAAYTPNPWLWLGGLGLGATLVCAAGWMATRSALSQPPMSTLRQG
jgi:putative ABC transport system permease protein